MAGHDYSPLPDTEVHYLYSDHVHDDFKILVGHCQSETAPEQVLFLGDPSFSFGTAVEEVRLLTYFADIPPTLIVAVGYDAATLAGNDEQRTRDFTPSRDPGAESGSPDVMHGAARFASFFRDELKPWVRERFSVNPDDSTFFGFSRGGIFGAYVLLTEPDLFARFGIGSPSLHLDGELIFDLEAHYASTYDDLAAKVFFSVGEYENSAGEKRWVDHHTDQLRAAAESIAEEEPFDIIADARRLVERLQSRRYPSLAIDFEVLPREYHHTAPPLALSRSLRYLLDAPS